MRRTKAAASTTDYELFHASDEFFCSSLRYGRGTTAEDIRRAFLAGHYRRVHTFEHPPDSVLERLEMVFYQSQNLDRRWKRSCRSTSVGDVVRVGSDYWIVAGQGFHKGWRD